MSKSLALLFGFAMVVAHIPGWSQPSIEPKSALLLGAGALAWGWLGWQGRPMGRYPWAFLLPVAWLALSACWSPAPSLGLQRILWLLAACGLGTLLAEEDAFTRFMQGFLAGTGIHAALIFLQWVPSIRLILPPSLGVDPLQGIGRGLFHNTNMAALPLVILVAWLLLSRTGQSWKGHLGWILPAIALTQSRLGIGVSAGMVAFAAVRACNSKGPALQNATRTAPLVLGALAWSLTAHRWGWLLPTGGALWGLLRRQGDIDRLPVARLPRSLAALGLALAVLAGLPTHAPKNAAQTLVRGTLIQGDVSLSQRLSYYRAATLAFLDRPLTGQGLGSARPIYPLYVDRNHPAAEIAYGDFLRPNNFHSEPLEWLTEGGLPLVLWLMLGLWLDRNSPPRRIRSALLLPIAVMALMDFPFHNPLGLLWVGLTLAPAPPQEESQTPWVTRFASGTLGLGLLVLAGLQVRTALLRPGLEQQFREARNPALTLRQARSLWQGYPYAADVFDLYSKAAVQNAGTEEGLSATVELDQLLRQDPFDHHLLLARAQVARRIGDPQTAQQMLARYAEVAPRDPDRYLRLAKDALLQGKPDAVRQLVLEAKRQPGFSPRHTQLIKELGGE